MKLLNSIPSNSVKLIELYNKIVSGALITGPDYQRKLVWKKQHKYAFIETILMNFPFPEIYIASSEMDIEKLQAKEVVVDGQQRLTAIVDYIGGKGDFSNQKSIKQFDALTLDEKKEFLNYFISVKDLKDIGDENIIEVFTRINSTDYSLNSNEKLNAQYGGGEFALFSKLLADKNYQATTKETDIVFQANVREYITDFFEKNDVFSEDDIKRMFDSQYIMLIASTILEGKYFGRNSKIKYYLEKYNFEFSVYMTIVEKLKNAISIINKLNLSNKSYWFNKANLFTLIIELKDVNVNEIDVNQLELRLIDLENKFDLYFNGSEEEIRRLSSDETKYFEVARQGSHELSARDHRGKVIKEIINFSKINNTSENSTLEKNLAILKEKNISFAIIIPTETGLEKGIMDATSMVREFLKVQNIHDYELQNWGPTNKKKMNGQFVNQDFQNQTTEISLYRSNGRGDFRIWFSKLSDFATAKDELVLFVKDGVLNILNVKKYDYLAYFNS